MNSITLTMTSEQPSPEIRYTTDDTDPGPVPGISGAPATLNLVNRQY